jgi:hypothetical protein
MRLDQPIDLEDSFLEEYGGLGVLSRSCRDEGLSVRGVMTRGGYAAMAGAEPWESLEIADPSWVPIGENVLVGLVYEATAGLGIDADEYRANTLSVYRRQEGSWQLTMHQQTPL